MEGVCVKCLSFQCKACSSNVLARGHGHMSSQSLLAKHFFITVAVRVLDGVEPALVPRFHALMDCFQERGTHPWLMAIPIPEQQWAIGMHHFLALLRYRLCMQMFSTDLWLPWTLLVTIPCCALVTPARVASPKPGAAIPQHHPLAG